MLWTRTLLTSWVDCCKWSELTQCVHSFERILSDPETLHWKANFPRTPSTWILVPVLQVVASFELSQSQCWEFYHQVPNLNIQQDLYKCCWCFSFPSTWIRQYYPSESFSFPQSEAISVQPNAQRIVGLELH